MMMMVMMTGCFIPSRSVCLAALCSGRARIYMRTYIHVSHLCTDILKPHPWEHVGCMPSAGGTCLFETVFCEE